MRRIFLYTALALGALVMPARALDTLRVGNSTAAHDWNQIAESTRFVAISADSLWTWTAERGDNLAAGLEERGGLIATKVLISTFSGFVETISEREGLEHWADGDAETAWGPDQDAETGRRSTIYMDLGATFRVDRIRFYPRLDREHRGLLLGSFEVASNDGQQGPLLDSSYRTIPGLSFSTFSPNRQPVVDVSFSRRDIRFIRLNSQTGEPWELAEFEVYAEGTAPAGEFVSAPLFIRGSYPIWGRMLYEGGDLDDLPITVQTRTGPDEEPLHYFLQRGDELERVSSADYISFSGLDFAGAAEVLLGPIRPNPEWSPWQTVTESLVRSPAPRRYIQFRIEMAEPGTAIENLLIEYVQQPLADELIAEISPLTVAAGQQTEFTLSLQAQLNSGRGDTGFRYLQVRTPASIGRVLKVRVDDEETVFTPAYNDEGFTIDIWQRILQSGTFIQVVFTATVLRDGTPFELRALDLRAQAGQIEPVYQTAQPGDIDLFSLGGELQVRLRPEDRTLIDALATRTAIFSPNGDGINDVFELSYNLLKLTRPAPVSFQIFDLSGRLVAQGLSQDRNGRFARLWRGTDANDHRVEPGLYLYRIKVEADAKTVSQQGIVNVAY
ncbi:MAG: hypothetical protein ACI906_002154 [Candidatus Latescibacterota bacterium]|jgi:hypothetical protein